MVRATRKRREEAVAEELHFSIDGEALTRLARERLLADNPGSAWRIITSLHGNGVAEAGLAVLRGDKKFIGVNIVELVDEDPAEAKRHKDRVAWLYAGRIRHRGRWYRPVAEVTSYGINDLVNDFDIPTPRIGPGKGYYNREWHYCALHEIAPLADRQSKHHNVIFEPCGEPPHWMEPAATFEEAVEQWKAAGRRLEERGHALWYPEDEAKLSESWRRTSLARRADSDDGADEGREEAAYQARIAELREKILAQAGEDMLVLAWGDGDDGTEAGCVKVPRAPFLHWAFERVRQFNASKPAWEPVSPSGLKMPLDNPYHTDWVIGAGFDPRDRRLYGGPISEAALHLAWLQQERYSAESGVHVIVDGEAAVGPIEHGKPNTACSRGAIVVLPNLHPRYVKTVQYAAAVITENGGETAHLAQVGRERRLPIVRIPDACHRFVDGEQVCVNTSRRVVEVIP